MIDGKRIEERLTTLGISQSALAKRVGVSQATIAHLVTGRSAGSKYLHAIARELQTTPAYLMADVDDPLLDAPPPPPKPTAQVAMMPVLLPDIRALESMFRGILRASEGLERDELAHELARLLPKGLGLLQGPLVFEDEAPSDVPEGEDASRRADRRVRRQA